MIQHILRSEDFDRSRLEDIFELTQWIAERHKDPATMRHLHQYLEGVCGCNLMYSLFYEPSTRTRFSFETAAKRIGMAVASSENADQFSSAVKGETLEDTIQVLAGYGPNVIVLRHKSEGAAHRASVVAEKYGVSIINAGDGKGQHPTQSLLDLYTIKSELGSIDYQTVVIGGDLAQGRTARSLAYLLAKFTRPRIIFVSPKELTIKEDVLGHLKEHSIEYHVITDPNQVHDALAQANVVYWTRVQAERFTDEETKRRIEAESLKYILGKRELQIMKKDSIILHPLPRVGEISKDVDEDPRAKYFKQAQNGLYIRIALLMRICNITPKT